jgi:hypothetical protein
MKRIGKFKQQMQLFFGNSRHFIIFALNFHKAMKNKLHTARAGIRRRLP